ncbi:hypothetical protein PROFUN_17029, partial [Planoprotostelium fungivorum]
PFCQGVRAGWAVSRKFLFSEFASACKPHFATVEEKVVIQYVIALVTSLPSMFNKSGFFSGNIKSLWFLSHAGSK